MVTGGRTPEELETLFEDALLLHDGEAAAQLFEARGVLVVGGGLQEARGREQIARIAADVSQSRCAYLADPRQVLQVRDTALCWKGSAPPPEQLAQPGTATDADHGAAFGLSDPAARL